VLNQHKLRFSGRRELALGLVAYGAYLVVRRAVLTPGGRRRAHANAKRVIRLERRLAVDLEGRVQQAVVPAPRLVRGLNAGYAALNVGFSAGWLALLFCRRDPAFARERRAALAAFLGPLPIFLAFPTAPPRTQEGYVDTLGGAGIDIEHPLLVRFYNPVAALPSHHAAFAVVTAGGLAGRTRGARRAAWAAYPPVVACVVVATANHYVLDVAAGAALGLAARRLTR
jgi:membrane-associated phospholipid phosphatase